ncbi:MAG TPA: dihydrolipoyl dehydrogenase, partial [Legionellales bacterium]|nr:dihydrolipoyl dehydrogenase [Legionellales bacterium]
MSSEIQTEIIVIGSGPGGYTAAFRAADLGKKVVLVEKFASLGGVCLNVGCIPSKALLHTAQVLDETKEMGSLGIEFGPVKIDAKKLKESKDLVVKKLTGGLSMLAKQRQVTVIQGTAQFSGPNSVEIQTAEGQQTVRFEQAIIAAGSESVTFPFIPEDPRIFSSTGALELRDIKGHLMVLGGGIIGLEMATVYRALGAEVTVVEFMDQLIPSADSDLVSVLQKRMQKKGIEFCLKTKATKIEAKKDGLYVT